MRFTSLDGAFGQAVDSFDIRTLADADLVVLLQKLYANRFLVLKTEGLTKAEYVAFAKRLGDPIPLSSDPETPEIAIISNLKTNTKQSRLGAAHWHTDQSFRKTVSSATMLYSVQAPKAGGATKFCNMAAAYEALPATTKEQLDDLWVEHRHGVSVSAPKDDHVPLPPRGWDQSYTVHHPLVRFHPETRQKSLYAVTGSAQGIRGMEPSEGARLLQELTQHVLQPQFVTAYAHQLHDLVVWDNPTVMHSATPIDEATPGNTRVLHRISLRGSPSVLGKRRHLLNAA